MSIEVIKGNKKFCELKSTQRRKMQKMIRELLGEISQEMFKTETCEERKEIFRQALASKQEENHRKKNLAPFPESVKVALQEAYADRRNKKSKEEAVQLASLFVQERYTSRDMAEVIRESSFNSHLYQMARQHAQAGLAGRKYSIHMVATRNRERYEQAIAFAVTTIIANCDGQTKGKEVHYSSGEKTPLSATYVRRHSVTRLMDIVTMAFLQRDAEVRGVPLEFDEKGKPLHDVIINGISHTDMRKLIKTIAPTENKCKGALDAITEIFGSKTLERLEVLMADVIAAANGDAATIALAKKAIEEIQFVRVYMKTDFNDHHKTHKDVLMEAIKQNHCHHWNMGVYDDSVNGGKDTDCGHIHDGRCLECDMIIDFLDSCYEAIGSLRKRGLLTVRSMESLVNRMDTCAERFMYYLGHQIRLVHESEYISSVNERIKKDHSLVLIEIDWAMKWLSMRYREKMVEWFGKKGKKLHYPIIKILNEIIKIPCTRCLLAWNQDILVQRSHR